MVHCRILLLYVYAEALQILLRCCYKFFVRFCWLNLVIVLPNMSSSVLPALQNVLPLLFDWLLGTSGNLPPRCTVGGSLSNGNKRDHSWWLSLWLSVCKSGMWVRWLPGGISSITRWCIVTGEKKVTAGILESKDRWKGAESMDTPHGKHDIQ